MKNPLLVAIGRFLFAYRNGVAPVVFIAVALLSPPRFLAGDPRLDHLLDALGILLACAGQTLRGLANGLAYIKRGGRDLQVYATELTTDGVYAHCRNPIYVGDTMIAAGLFVVHNGVLAYLLGLPLILVGLACIIAAEEAYLRGKFGAAYAEYCGRTPRIGFRFAGLGETFRAGTFDWSRVVRKDYGTTFGWITGLVVLLVWQNAVAYGFDPRRPAVIALGYIWALAFVGWLSVWLYKTDRRRRAILHEQDMAAEGGAAAADA